ncbi:ankyrin repeat-containing protein isoform X2 [Gossypium australe]|uniref:Ankyrin repeat-containing protein isoform X2 n=1 Tax=Gossypium australe TaxID=47621 RepID=A0A5B6W7B0_9ROSI|nr:ankyrin repeat-containing protein isoform X2 [Gossypium australe]
MLSFHFNLIGLSNVNNIQKLWFNCISFDKNVTVTILQIVKFLLTIPGLDINAMNKNGFTALDTLKQSPRYLRDMEIESILRDAGVLSSKDRYVIAVKWVPSPSNIPKITKSQIAMVAYQAAIAPLGDALQGNKTVDEKENPLEHCRKAGTAIMAYNQGIEYGHFMILNTLAFFSSLSIILQLVSGLPIKRRG